MSLCWHVIRHPPAPPILNKEMHLCSMDDAWLKPNMPLYSLSRGFRGINAFSTRIHKYVLTKLQENDRVKKNWDAQ